MKNISRRKGIYGYYLGWVHLSYSSILDSDEPILPKSYAHTPIKLNRMIKEYFFKIPFTSEKDKSQVQKKLHELLTELTSSKYRAPLHLHQISATIHVF
jgi:hypothetical protein